MFLTNKKRVKFPSKLEMDKNDLEVLNEDTLLGVIIDNILSFNIKYYVENTKFLVKLFSIKKF